MNIVVNVPKDFKPTNNCILVYNESSEKWEVRNKVAFLSEVSSEIANLKAKDEAQEEEISKLKEQLSKIAKILKEKL